MWCIAGLCRPPEDWIDLVHTIFTALLTKATHYCLITSQYYSFFVISLSKIFKVLSNKPIKNYPSFFLWILKKGVSSKPSL